MVESFENIKIMVSMRRCLSIGSVLCILATAGYASGNEESVVEQGEAASRLVRYTAVNAGLLAMYNPAAGAAFLRVQRNYPYKYSEQYRAVWSHFGAGTDAVLCPAYTNLNAALEWMPALFSVLRLTYGVFFRHGIYGETLSYREVPSGLSEQEVNSRWGEEEPAFGQRVMLQVTLRGQVGKFVAQSQTDSAWYDTRVDGPYIFNWDYETMTKPSDFIIENRTDILIEMQRGQGESCFLVGPEYSIAWTFGTRIRRQRVGAVVYWVPVDRPDKKGYAWLSLASGVNVEAFFEKGSPYLLFAAGFSWPR